LKVEFLKKFSKDLDNLKKPQIQHTLISLIESLEAADSTSDIPNLKKLKGSTSAYRIRIGDYRIGVFIENDVIELARIAHRKDIYNIFP
jgi:mRNA interferase RelE/StbE